VGCSAQASQEASCELQCPNLWRLVSLRLTSPAIITSGPAPATIPRQTCDHRRRTLEGRVIRHILTGRKTKARGVAVLSQT
jgi:hypothetical protein